MRTKKFEELTQLLSENQLTMLSTELNEMNEIDVADFLSNLKDEKAIVCFRMLAKDLASDVFPELDPEMQEYIITSITDNELKRIVEDLYVDDAVDMLEEMPASVVKRVLQNATPQTRNLINQFLKYPDNSAGSVMTSEFVSLKKDMTVAQALAHIRQTGIDKETVYLAYVTSKSRVLEGVVSFRSLLFSDFEDTIENIMEDDVIYGLTTEDQEETVKKLSKYDLLALPIVDSEHRLVGIVTVDDAIDVLEEEATEDFEKMAGMAPSEKPYLKTSIFDLSKNRIVWLLVLMVSSMFTGKILESYEAAFTAIPLLVTFIPMLTDTGGNSGAQSSTLVIRGMAISEIATKDWYKVLFKEFQVGVLCGAILAVLNYIRLVLMYPGQSAVALTVAISLFFTVLIAKTVGAVLPIIAKKTKMDPAIMASPLITTIVDALALILYFQVAHVLLQL